MPGVSCGRRTRQARVGATPGRYPCMAWSGAPEAGTDARRAPRRGVPTALS